MLDNNIKEKKEENQKYLEKLEFYNDTISCKRTDRVLTAPMVMYLPILYYNETSIKDTMDDYKNCIPSFIRYHEEFQPDLAWGPESIFPGKPLDIMGCQYVQWPGKHFNDPNRGFQVLDHEYMQQDEYLEYAEDPTGFMIRKVMPRHYSALEGMSMIDFSNFIYTGGLYATIPFAFPPVKNALTALCDSGASMLEYVKASGMYKEKMKDMGLPMAQDFVAIAPFDLFNDTLRGLINTSMDMLECPDELLIALEASTKMQVRAIKEQMLKRPVKTVIFFIHNGMDNFMSLEQYETFYWPGLKACIDAIIEMGGVPHLYLEANYEAKLDLFAKELVPGTCIITFIDTNMEKVKEKLTGKVCISGGVDGTALQYGTPEQVTRNVKNAIDICAPGGGYFLNCDVSLDLAKPENLKALFETAKNYMKY